MVLKGFDALLVELGAFKVETVGGSSHFRLVLLDYVIETAAQQALYLIDVSGVFLD